MKKRKIKDDEDEDSSDDNNPIAAILQKLTSKKNLSPSEKREIAKYLTITPKDDCKKRQELNEPIFEGVKELPEKNVYSYMWSLLLSTCLTEMKQRGDDFVHNSDMLVDVFVNILKNVHDVCQKVNLFQAFWSNFDNNFTFTIIVNDSITISSPCLKKEPIFAAFTPEFTMSDSEEEEEESKKKRKTYIIINTNLIQKLFEQYIMEMMSLSGGGDSGLFFVDCKMDNKREGKQMYKLFLILVMHMLGHIDLFMKYGYCFYESHKKVSSFQTMSNIFKKKG